MKLKGIIFEDFVNYKKPSMTLMFPNCSFKCGYDICQNKDLINQENIFVNDEHLIQGYLNNPITEAIVMQGLEPFDSWGDLIWFVKQFRRCSDDDIVIYTGYEEQEINSYVLELKDYPNIIIKFGRYKQGNDTHIDNVLGVVLSSDNQYAIKIS